MGKRFYIRPGLWVGILLLLGCGGGYKIPLVSGPGIRVEVKADASRSAGILDHSWETVIGSGNAGLYVREVWGDKILEHLADAHQNLGIQTVRFHGVFGDQVGVFQGPGCYDFSQVDKLYDGIKKAGVKPFIELSFMPKELASGKARGFPLGYKPYISPPKSYEEWGGMIESFTRHLLERYGREEVEGWYFEVWNEPNLSVFWAGDMDAYFQLYEVTVKAIKSVDPALKVGGPASSQAAWIWEFLEHCSGARLPVDFVSTHGYGNEKIHLLIPQAEKAGVKVDRGNSRGFFYDEVRLINEIMARSSFGKLPLYITEWNSSVSYSYQLSAWPNDHDLPNDAAFICKAVKEVNGYTAGFSHWTHSDVFEEWGLPGTRWPVKNGVFHGGFGLITIDGIHKPSYHSFVFLHQMGTNLIETKVNSPGPGIEAMATLDQNQLSVLVWRYLDTAGKGETGGPMATVSLELVDLPESLLGKKMIGYRIDQDHGNPFAEWIKMGKPAKLTPEELSGLKTISDTSIRAKEMDARIDRSDLSLSFALPPAGVVFLKSE